MNVFEYHFKAAFMENEIVFEGNKLVGATVDKISNKLEWKISHGQPGTRLSYFVRTHSYCFLVCFQETHRLKLPFRYVHRNLKKTHLASTAQNSKLTLGASSIQWSKFFKLFDHELMFTKHKLDDLL